MRTANALYFFEDTLSIINDEKLRHLITIRLLGVANRLRALKPKQVSLMILYERIALLHMAQYNKRDTVEAIMNEFNISKRTAYEHIKNFEIEEQKSF